MIPPALTCFRELAACGSVRRAADKLSIAPSAVSRQIANLEAQLLTFLPRYAALHEIANGDLCAVPLQDRAFASNSISLITVRDQRLSLASRTMLDALLRRRCSEFGNRRVPASGSRFGAGLLRVGLHLSKA